MNTEIIARAIVHRDDRVLVVRERTEAFFFLPGGHLEPGETPEEALVRELAEELDTAATITSYLGEVEYEYVTDTPHHEINHVFTATITTPDPVSHEPHLEVSWLRADQLADSDLRPAAMKSLIADVLS